MRLVLPNLYPKQYKAIFAPLGDGSFARLAIVEASTKSGKSFGCALWLLRQAAVADGRDREFVWVAPVYSQAQDIGFKNIASMLRAADPGQTVWTSSSGDPSITLKWNGSKIWFKGSDNHDSIYGHEYWAAVIDEGSRCKKEAWAAVTSTTTFTEGPIRIIGNVKGQSNWVYKLGAQVRAGVIPKAAYAKLTCYDAVEAGILSADYIAEQKSRLPKPVFDELFLAVPADVASSFFSGSVIDEHRREHARDPVRYEWSGGRLLPVDNGSWHMWIGPDDLAKRTSNYAMGIDISTGKGSSNSVIAVFDRESRRLVAEYVNPNILPHELAEVACGVGMSDKAFGGQIGQAFMAWESNGPGEGFYKDVLRHDYNFVYWQRRTGTAGDLRTKEYGWHSTRPRKLAALTDLHSSLCRKEIQIQSSVGLDEAVDYIYYDDGSIGPGLVSDATSGAKAAHGDRVIAYALGLMACDEAPRFQPAMPQFSENQFGYIHEMVASESTRPGDPFR